MEFALVKDPGGENPQCDDLGVATIDLVETILAPGTDYIEQTLAVVGGVALTGFVMLIALLLS